MKRVLPSVAGLCLVGIFSGAGCGDGDCIDQSCSEFGGSSDKTVTTCSSSGSSSSDDEFVVKGEDGEELFSCTRPADDNDGCGVGILAAKEAYCAGS